MAQYSGGVSDYQAGINFDRMRAERLSRAKAALQRHDIAAALFVLPQNLRYTMAVRAHLFAPQLSYALVFAERDPILFEIGTMIEHQRVYCPWIKPENIRLAYSWLAAICGPDAAKSEARKFADAIVRALKENGALDQRVGTDALDELGRAALRAEGVDLVDAKPAIMQARRCKTADEIACIETVIAIANNGFRSFLSFKPGMRERDGGAAMYEAMIRAGAENVLGGVRSKQNTFDVYHVANTDRIVDPGDLVTVHTCSTTYAGYRNCMYRSFIVGRPPNAKERDFYKVCYDRVYGVIDGIRPGGSTRGSGQGAQARENLGI